MIRPGPTYCAHMPTALEILFDDTADCSGVPHIRVRFSG